MADIKKKTIYTAYSRLLSMAIGTISQLVLTPIILSFFGTTLYGIYTIVNKTNNFLSLVDIRPTAILRLKLAHDQNEKNLIEKQKYIGASYIISLLFLPIFVGGGCLVGFYLPEWFHIDTNYLSEARLTILLMSIFLAINGFLGIPEAILRGNNLEYKGYFVEPIRQLLVAGFTILFLYWNWGLLSAVCAMFIGSVFAYVTRLILQKKFLSGFTASSPQVKHVKYFFNKGGWYLGSSFLMQIINNFDVILIGVLMNPESVTLFAITKSIVFRVVESVESLVTSATSSVGEIVGGGNKDRIHHTRTEIFHLVWPIALFFTSYFYIFNESLITHWTGASVYAGNIVNIIICLSSIFLMFTCTEEIFILSSLNFKKKSFYLCLSALIGITMSVVLNKPLGLIGNAVGILAGRIALFVSYNIHNNRWLGKALSFDMSMIYKSLGLIILSIVFKLAVEDAIVSSFIGFIFYSIVFVIIAGLYSYLNIFSDNMKKKIKSLIFKK